MEISRNSSNFIALRAFVLYRLEGAGGAMRVSICASVLLIAATQWAGATAFAQQMAMAPAQPDCPSQEPDSLQISWTEPCEQGDWLLDTRSGCRMWDWHPDVKDRAMWSGTCPAGKKEG